LYTVELLLQTNVIYIKVDLILQINIFNAIPRAHESSVPHGTRGFGASAGTPLMPHSSQLTLIINEPLNISKMQSKAAQQGHACVQYN